MSAEELKNDPKFQKQAAMATAFCDKVLKEYITLIYPDITFDHTFAITEGFTLEKDNVKRSFCFAIVDKDYMLDLSDQTEGARKQFANLMTHMQGCLMMLYTLISAEDGKSDIIKGLKMDPANTTYYLEDHEEHEKRIGFVLSVHVPAHKRGRKEKK